MILSHAHRYVFIETPRTGSRAVATELVEQYDGIPILYTHATYRDFLRRATPDERTYFAFSGIRNPLDIAVSRYTELTTNESGRFTDAREIRIRSNLAGRFERRLYQWVQRNNASFEAFLLRWYVLPYDTWTSLDHKRLDAVLRNETLGDDFEAALRRLRIEPKRPLPVRNVTEGRDPGYVDRYTPRAIRRAAWVFGPYMAEWGYAFPAAWGQVRTPAWSRLLLRAIRPMRSLYWTGMRFRDYGRGRATRPWPTAPGDNLAS